MRAVALAQTDMTEFILRTALREAQSVIAEHEQVKLSKRDSLRVFRFWKPPRPPARSCAGLRGPCRSGHELARLA